jgi:hypothetical protein
MRLSAIPDDARQGNLVLGEHFDDAWGDFSRAEAIVSSCTSRQNDVLG